ncbi:mechanosensitive ion channel family protein [Candidatus Babeliales bacterium]|nr:mechanosensitive ion channel family protein [Candidatus Babeliales bacterium]
MINSIYNFFLSGNVIECFLILIITLITIFVSQKILYYLKKTSKNDWIKSFCDALYFPLKWIVFGYGFLTIIENIVRNNQTFNHRILQLQYIFVISVMTWILFRFKNCFEKKIVKKFLSKSKNHENDRIVISAVSKLVSIIIVVITVFMILDIIGIPLSGLLAFGGMSGIAFSWAAKDIVANFFGGFMLYVNRPFVIGDTIKSPNKGFHGTVEDIGWYMTRICTFEKTPMYIPNALITDAIVENSERRYNRRIMTTISLRYDDIKRVKNIINDIEIYLNNNFDIDRDKGVLVNFESFGEYSIDISVYTFTKTTKWGEFRKVQQDVLLKIADIVEKNDAEFAFPTQQIKLNNGSFKKV